MKTESDYPEKVDGFIFYNDMSVNQAPVAEQYYGQLHASNYSAASQILKENLEHYYGADVFNLLENRIEKLQSHLKSKTKKNPHKYSVTRPVNMKNGDMWIG